MAAGHVPSLGMVTGFHVLPGPASVSGELHRNTRNKKFNCKGFLGEGGKENAEQYVMHDFFDLKTICVDIEGNLGRHAS